MQNILVVKNDELFLNTVSERLILSDNVSFLDRLGHSIPDGFFDLEIYKASNGQQAIKTLNQYPIDIVITDLKMPKVNGFDLIIHMNNHFPNTPIIVMADIAPISICKILNQDGISHYIERPFSIEAIKKSVLEVLIVKLLNPEQSIYSNISLASLMQLISTSKMTYTIYTKSNNKVGRIYFLYGKLISAETEKNIGEDAIYELLGWKDPIILLEPTCNDVEETIKVSLIQILKKSIRALSGFGKIDSSKLLKQDSLPPAEKSSELKKIYRQLAKRFHPDLNDDFTEEVKNYWLLIMNAYNNGELENLKILSLITSSIFDLSRFPGVTEKRKEKEEKPKITQEKQSEEEEPFAETLTDEEYDEDFTVGEDIETESEGNDAGSANVNDEEVTTEKVSSEEEPQKSVAHEIDFDTAEVRKILSALLSVNGFMTAAIISDQGRLLLLYPQSGDAAIEAGTRSVNALLKKSSELTMKLNLDKAEDIILSSANGFLCIHTLLFSPTDRGQLLVLLNAQGNLALTKITMNKIIPALNKEIKK
ncbi:MAG: response regulator [Candidatus Cloacimonetes bacterium]|nr:response regulator [Candidatus Cloacimonadota bacterium]